MACPAVALAEAGELPDSAAGHGYSFSAEELPFELEVAAEAAEPSARGDDAVAGNAHRVALAHDVADGAARARAAGGRGDVPIGGDTARRDSPDGSEHARPKCPGDRHGPRTETGGRPRPAGRRHRMRRSGSQDR